MGITLEKKNRVLYRIEPFYFNDDYEAIELSKGFNVEGMKKDKFYDYMQNLFYATNGEVSNIAKTYVIHTNQYKDITFHNSVTQEETVLLPLEYKNRHDSNYKIVETGETVTRRILFDINKVHIVATASHVGMIVYEIAIDRILQFPANMTFSDDELKNERLAEELPFTPENYEWAAYALRHLTYKHVTTAQGVKNGKEIQAYHEAKKEAKKNGKPFDLEEPSKYVYKQFLWTDFTDGIITKIFKNPIGFTENEKIGKYALLYSGAIVLGQQLDQQNRALENHLFKISRGYKETYYKEADETDIIKPFNNVWWSFSDEGAASFVLEIDDENAMKFFREQYADKWQTNYFYMYLLALIQKFSALYYTMKTNERLANSLLYNHDAHTIESLQKELTDTRELYHSILKFQMQSYHEQVSPLTHYNDLYREILEKLRIPQIMTELQEKLSTFHEVIESVAKEKMAQERERQRQEEKERYEKQQQQAEAYKRQQEKQRQEKQEQINKQNTVIQTITYLFLPATLATGVLGMNIPFVAESKNMLFLAVICGVIAFTAGATWLLQRSKIKSSSITVFIISFILFMIFISVYIYNLQKNSDNDHNDKVQIEQLCERIENCK